MKKVLYFIGSFFLFIFFASPASATTTTTQNITTDTTWTASSSPYLVNANISVNSGVTLTIDPDVVVKFNNTYSLTVNGTLQVNGTSNQRVHFTSYHDDTVGGNIDGAGGAPAAGNWGALKFPTGAVGNINFADIRYGGNTVLTGVYVTGGALTLSDNFISTSTSYGIYMSTGTLSVSSSTINNHTAYGVYSLSGSLTLNNNLFNNNDLAAKISATVNFTHTGNTATGGTQKGFWIYGTFASNQTWYPDIPYLISDSLTIPVGKTLTIGAGSVVKFYDNYLYPLIAYGNLQVNGETNNKVYFTSIHDDSVYGDTNGNNTSTVPVAGKWGSIAIGSASQSSLTSVELSYGGYYWSQCSDANCLKTIILNNGGAVNLNDVRISSSTKFGFLQMSGSSTSTNSWFNNQQIGFYQQNGNVYISSSSFSNNSTYGILTEAGALTVTGSNFVNNGMVGKIPAAVNFASSLNTASGTGNKVFWVYGTLTANQTWNAGVPYLIAYVPTIGTLTVPSGKTLTINEGAMIKFDTYLGYNVRLNVGGTLQVNGTPENKVFFTSIKDDSIGGDTNGDAASTTPAAGDWDTLKFDSNSVGNINSAEVRYGGNVSLGLNEANIHNNGGKLTLYDVHLASSTTRGLFQSSGSSTSTESEFFNTKEGIRMTGGNAIVLKSSFHDLSLYGIYNAGNLIHAENTWWGHFDGPSTSAPSSSQRIYGNVTTSPHLLYRPIAPGAKIKIAIILTQTYQKSHTSGYLFRNPCKIIGESVYLQGHATEYYQDLFTCVKDYYDENSFNKVSFATPTIFSNNDSWYQFTGANSTTQYYSTNSNTTLDFIKDSISIAGVNEDDFDIIISLHEGTKNDIPSLAKTLVPGAQKIILAEEDRMGAWVHELGHTLGALLTQQNTSASDLYKMGDVGGWDVMSHGWENGFRVTDYSPFFEDGWDPTYMSSFNRIFFGWLNQKIYKKTWFYDQYWIGALAESNFGDEVFRYNLDDTTSTSFGKYYLIEARKEGLKNWDTSFPSIGDKGLVLYYVDEKQKSMYGYDGNYPSNMGMLVTIYGNTSTPSTSTEGIAILYPGVNIFQDLNEMVKFSAPSDRVTQEGKYEINLSIEDLSQRMFSQSYTGSVLLPNNLFYDNTLTGFDQNPPNHNSLFLPPPKPYPPDSLPVVVKNFFQLQLLLTIILIGVFVFEKRCSKLKSLNLKFISIQTANILTVVHVTGLIFLNILITLSYSFDAVVRLAKDNLAPWPLNVKFNLSSNAELSYLIIIFTISLFVIGLVTLFEMKFINWVKFKITKNRIDRRIVLQSATISSFVFVIIIYNLFSAAYKSEESKIINKYNNFGSDLLNVFQHNIRPVLDLHLFCDDGRHIGLNYETGQFENQIPGSQVSGPASGAPEWIYIPASTTATCRYEVSAIKNKKFLDENPELKAKDIDKSDSYDIYARYIDPESGIFTSKKVEKQRIQPGEELEHTATGKLDIEISSGKKKESNKPKTNNVVL